VPAIPDGEKPSADPSGPKLFYSFKSNFTDGWIFVPSVSLIFCSHSGRLQSANQSKDFCIVSP
jgi:hypothetical protein